jgi:glycosyltransferase involved in cell wall biosynthesis
MRVFVITKAVPPKTGGLEAWTFQLAGLLAAAKYSVTVIVTGAQKSSEIPPRDDLEVLCLEDLRTKWEPPLSGSDAWWRWDKEIHRLNFLLSKNIIGGRVRLQQERFLIVTNFAIGTGYLGMQLAEECKARHVACVVGTDFSRGFRNPEERQIIEAVCRTAWLVVAKSTEQAIGLAKFTETIKVIPTSMKTAPVTHERVPSFPFRIFSDSGYSFKKGTFALVEAWARLDKALHGTYLNICGPTDFDEGKYWKKWKEDTVAVFGDKIIFEDFLTPEDVDERLSKCDVYCSASLGEGSSAARLNALRSGVPVVTSATGEMCEPVIDHNNVRLFPAGDFEGLTSRLNGLLSEMAAGKFRFRHESAQAVHEYFSLEREREAWLGVVGAAFR